MVGDSMTHWTVCRGSRPAGRAVLTVSRGAGVRGTAAMVRLLVPLVTAGVLLVLAAGATAGRVSARTISGLPQHFLHPFINFWEVHPAPEVFPKLNGVSFFLYIK